MLRARLFRRIGFVASLAVVIASLGLHPALSTAAQDATPVPVASPETSPAATPVGSPTAKVLAEEMAFVAGDFRITVAAAKRGEAIDEVGLRLREGKDWIVVLADVSNWSSKNTTLFTKDFAIRLAGSAEPRGFAARTTETVAGVLGLQPTDVGAGVKIDKNTTVRIALVFQIDHDGANPALVHDDQALPLASALAANASLTAPPPVTEPPALEVASVEGVPDGATLTLANGGGTVRLVGLDAPRPDECFGGQATSRLKKLAGDEVLLETAADGTAYVWTEQTNGSRRLINYDLLVSGFAALAPDQTGVFADWLRDGEEMARTTLAGLWGACTSAHGVAKTIGPERHVLALRSGDTNRDYAIWGVRSWAPVLVTTPDGGAWTFFSARSNGGPDEGKSRLYASHYDPSTGSWTPATPMPGGDVQFGPAAVVDARGLVHLVYSDRAKDEKGVFSTLMYTHEDGSGGWTEPVAVAPSDLAGHQIAPSLTIDAAGTLHVLWQDQRAFSAEARQAAAENADIFASDLPPGGAWTEPVQVNKHLPTAAGSRPHVVVDGDRLVAVWTVYTSALGLTAAARIDWATRPLANPEGWSAPQALIVGRGERFGGRGVDLAADPNGGVVLAFTRQLNDTFLFVRRLKADATEWGGDVLITAGNRGTYPSITVSQQGVVYITYNVGIGSVVDVGAVAIPFRSIQPGREILLTQDDPNTQGIAVVTTDVTGSPWVVYFSEIPGSDAPNKVYVLRNAEIPTT
jgi:endonuclease YncB( thermonuclease family)